LPFLRAAAPSLRFSREFGWVIVSFIQLYA
jgi:hypothetical protein